MRVFTNLLLVLSVVFLAFSAWRAPQVRSADGESAAAAGLIITDPMTRARLGDEERALGVALRGYEEAIQMDPTDPEATNGIMRAAVRLGAVALGQREIAHILLGAFEQYIANRAVSDPDGEQLQEAIRDWVELRREHDWFLARAAVGMWLAARGDARGIEALEGLSKKGPFWREYFPYVQRYLPDWRGVEPQVRRWLESNKLLARIYAGVTLMTYHRLYGVGDDLWQKHKRAIGDALVEHASAMRPSPDEDAPETPGGFTLLGLALYDSPTTNRIIERLKPLEHPYLARVVLIAKAWTGAMPFSTINFDNKRYEVWRAGEREFFYRGAILRYAQLVRDGKLEEAKALEEGTIADALVQGAGLVKINTRRGLAAVHPERSVEIHQELIDAGGLSQVFGAFGVPGADMIAALLPALSSPEPDFSALAAVGLLRMDGPPPIQVPSKE